MEVKIHSPQSTGMQTNMVGETMTLCYSIAQCLLQIFVACQMTPLNAEVGCYAPSLSFAEEAQLVGEGKHPAYSCREWGDRGFDDSHLLQ